MECSSECSLSSKPPFTPFFALTSLHLFRTVASASLRTTYTWSVSFSSVQHPGMHSADSLTPLLVFSSHIQCHEPRYWSATDQYKATLLQGKQAQDMPLWFPYQLRPRWAVGNSRGHSLVQVPECGKKSNQAWESCTTIRRSGD